MPIFVNRTIDKFGVEEPPTVIYPLASNPHITFQNVHDAIKASSHKLKSLSHVNGTRGMGYFGKPITGNEVSLFASGMRIFVLDADIYAITFNHGIDHVYKQASFHHAWQSL